MVKENNDQNGEIQMEAKTSSGNVVDIKQLVIDIEKSFKSSYPDSASPTKPRIYKVPGHLRRVNAKAYTPTLISIGPFHHRNEKFKTREELKLRYGKCFREQEKADMEKLVNNILEKKNEIRSCYAKISDSPCFHSDDNYFVTMILVDAIFILELFLSCFPKTDKSNQENHDSTDPIKAEPWMLSVVTLDLVLLENQLPFFVIKDLYNTVFSTKSGTRPSLFQLIFNFFAEFNFQGMEPDNFNVEIKHFTDLLRTFYLPPPPTSSRPSTPSKSKRCNWFSGITRKLITRNEAAPESELIKLNEAPASELIPASGSITRDEAPANGSKTRDEEPASELKRDKVRKLLYSATQLHEAGVKFEKSTSKCLLDLDFDKSNGVLKIPGLELNDSAEARIRNVMAYEQFDLGEKISITDYLMFLDFLINTSSQRYGFPL